MPTKTYYHANSISQRGQEWCVDPGHDKDIEYWPLDEWWLEIVLYKKSRPFKPGDRVDSISVGALDKSFGTVVRVDKLMRRVDVSWDVSPTVVSTWEFKSIRHVED